MLAVLLFAHANSGTISLATFNSPPIQFVLEENLFKRQIFCWRMRFTNVEERFLALPFHVKRDMQSPFMGLDP